MEAVDGYRWLLAHGAQSESVRLTLSTSLHQIW